MKESLKDCPFCHEFPVLIKNPLWHGSHGYIGSYEFFVQCDNENCLVRPKTRAYDTISRKSESECKELAYNAWNNR